MKKLLVAWLMAVTLSCVAMKESDDNLPMQKVIIDGNDILIVAADNNVVLPEKPISVNPNVLDLNKVIDENGNTALIQAVRNRVSHADPLQLVKLLIQYGASVNKANDSGWTPLHYACYYGKPEVIAELIKQGADLNAETKEKSIPLHVILSVAENSAPKLQAFLSANEARKTQQN